MILDAIYGSSPVNYPGKLFTSGIPIIVTWNPILLSESRFTLKVRAIITSHYCVFRYLAFLIAEALQGPANMIYINHFNGIIRNVLSLQGMNENGGESVVSVIEDDSRMEKQAIIKRFYSDQAILVDHEKLNIVVGMSTASLGADIRLIIGDCPRL